MRYDAFARAGALIVSSLIVMALATHQVRAGDGVNVLTFLDAVARTCGGSAGESVVVTGDNIALKQAHVTVDKGTGSLVVRKDGVLIAELSGEGSTPYYECVRNLTNALGGIFLDSNEARSAVEVPVFFGLVAEASFSHENGEFLSFVDENRLRVVFLRLFVSHRIYTGLDSAVEEVGFCDTEHSILEAGGARLLVEDAKNYNHLSKTYVDWDAWHETPLDERQYLLDLNEVDHCSSFAVEVIPSSVERWDDNGVAISGFFLIDDTGFDINSRVVRLRHREGTNEDWSYIRERLASAEEERGKRIEAWWRFVSEFRSQDETL
ncbi:MAG: hypothetical protein AAFY02_15685 [Pseudomonadota bacterium]